MLVAGVATRLLNRKACEAPEDSRGFEIPNGAAAGAGAAWREMVVDGAAAALQRNEAALEVARANLTRTKPLVELNALSQRDLDDARGQFEQSGAAVAQSKAQLDAAQLDLSYATIKSPVDGVSSFSAVADGTYLDSKNAQLTTVSVLSPMWINFSLSENDMGP